MKRPAKAKQNRRQPGKIDAVKDETRRGCDLLYATAITATENPYHRALIAQTVALQFLQHVTGSRGADLRRRAGKLISLLAKHPRLDSTAQTQQRLREVFFREVGPTTGSTRNGARATQTTKRAARKVPVRPSH